jgi:hypothetical protein
MVVAVDGRRDTESDAPSDPRRRGQYSRPVMLRVWGGVSASVEVEVVDV